MRTNGAVKAGAAALALVVVAALVAAWLVGGRAFEAGAPLDAPPAVPATGVGSPVVTLSADALAHPLHQAVLDRLQAYFDAINARDRAAWAAVVTPERAAQQPEAAWQAGVRSTRDGSVRVDRIDAAGPGTVEALVRFVSTQDVADAPADLRVGRICWRQTLHLAGTPPRIEPGATLAQPC
ncbi:hypothetical protein GCM10009836_43200 [Pseudonocardia ailaonensis]|uniref:SnoaL-like domain-containing protein n=1 Tax=Pseudonocardia ailaonensis TaxID=367279 RepID=A0ABN2N910_9PSEU